MLQRLRNNPLFFLVMLCLISGTVFLVLYPLMQVICYPHLPAYLGFWGNRRWVSAFGNSMWMMLLSMTSCTALAFLFAYTVVRLPVPCKKLFRFVTLLPVVSPPFIVALSYILLFGSQGLITKKLLGLNVSIYGWLGLWIVQTITFFPFAYTVIENVMSKVSENMEYAALNLGASRKQVFRDVFWPLCRPGLAGGAMMTAMNVLADFGNPMMIGGNLKLLPTEAYMQMVGWYNLDNATVLAVVLLVPTLIIFLFNRYWLGKRSYVMISGKESALPRLRVHPLIKWSLFASCLLVSLFVLAVYGVLLVGAFTRTWGYDWSFTLNSFAYVWEKKDLILNSLYFSAFAAALACAIGLGLAYFVHRYPNRFGKWIDLLGVLPGAIPGVFLGLGFSMAFNGKPFYLAGTGALMILALAVWNIPACYSANHASLSQLGDSLENAARNSGASAGRSFRDIVFPILRVPVLSGFSLSFLRSMTCLSVVIFLYGARTSVSTITILSLVNSGDWSGAAAFTAVTVTLAFIAMGVFQFILMRSGRFGRVRG